MGGIRENPTNQGVSGIARDMLLLHGDRQKAVQEAYRMAGRPHTSREDRRAWASVADAIHDVILSDDERRDLTGRPWK